MAQTSALPDPPLLPFLASFEGGSLPALKVGDGLLLKWRASEAAFQGGANALRYHQGRVLSARLASIPHGERSAFKDEMGGLLHLSRRSVELRMQIATELDLLLSQEEASAGELRRSVLDRPWRDVLAAVRLALHGPPVVDEDDFSVAPEEPPDLADDGGRVQVWRSQIGAIEEESFDSLDELNQWVQVLNDALERAEERREELADEVTEVPAARDLEPTIRVATTRRPPRWSDAGSDGLKVSFIRGDGD